MNNDDLSNGDEASIEEQRRVAEALARDDLRGVAWSWLARLSRSLGVAEANKAVGWARLLQRLGADAGDSNEAILEASVLGGVMHGFAPRTEEQWEYARETFDPETLAVIEQWAGRRSADDERRTTSDGEGV